MCFEMSIIRRCREIATTRRFDSFADHDVGFALVLNFAARFSSDSKARRPTKYVRHAAVYIKIIKLVVGENAYTDVNSHTSSYKAQNIKHSVHQQPLPMIKKIQIP
ncbi:MAG: hypothetical protein C0490_16260 [Marivirga sp.]|nr:hypothetical protein [Marivirga sp.]